MDDELRAAELLAVKNMDYFAWRADWEQLPLPLPGPNYSPDYQEMTGKLSCKACGREIREHRVTEWHPRL